MKTQTTNQTLELTKKFDLQLRAILLNELRALKNSRNAKITNLNPNNGLMVA